MFAHTPEGGAHFQSHYLKDATNTVLARTIPFAIHGDGPPLQGIGKAWAKQVEVWSWQSLLCRSSTNLLDCFFFCGCVSTTPVAFYVYWTQGYACYMSNLPRSKSLFMQVC